MCLFWIFKCSRKSFPYPVPIRRTYLTSHHWSKRHEGHSNHRRRCTSNVRFVNTHLRPTRRWCATCECIPKIMSPSKEEVYPTTPPNNALLIINIIYLFVLFANSLIRAERRPKCAEPIDCHHCAKIFNTYVERKNHLINVLPGKKHCAECALDFPSRTCFLHHYDTTHLVDNPLRCVPCDQRFSRWYGWDHHRRHRHSVFECTECQISFDSK